MITRVIGLGQPVAGDDGVGVAVLDALRDGAPAGAELVHAREASAVIPLLEDAARVIVVDAVVTAGPPGRVLVLTPNDLDATAPSSVSSHGVSVAQALALGLALSSSAPAIRVVAVTIEAPTSYGDSLSPPVARAVPEAARCVAALLASDWKKGSG